MLNRHSFRPFLVASAVALAACGPAKGPLGIPLPDGDETAGDDVAQQTGG
jgi:predicted small lipoprotein YifL